MDKFPIDAPKQKVLGAFKKLGFYIVRETICQQSGISREEFLRAYK
jgi:hypothetical protein